MKLEVLKKVRGGLLAGSVYALIMAGFDYVDGESFRIWRFLWNFSFFGIVMGWLTTYDINKRKK